MGKGLTWSVTDKMHTHKEHLREKITNKGQMHEENTHKEHTNAKQSTIISYARKQEASFAELPINEVDSLILTWLTYLHLPEEILPRREMPEGEEAKFLALTETESCRIADFLKEEYFKELLCEIWSPEETLEMLHALAKNPRFADVRFCMRREALEYKVGKQFAAVTYQLPNDLVYVAFRGTDKTFTGWEEDFRLCLKEPVPSQQMAADYLTAVANIFRGKLCVGGHSKGGNLAVYAAAHTTPEVQNRIETIFTHDGPGFLPEDLEFEGFRRIQPLIRKTAPQFSIFGMLMKQESLPKIIYSYEHGIMQHNATSWKVDELSFSEYRYPDKAAQFLKNKVNNWIDGLSFAERERFIDIIFNILEEVDFERFADLKTNLTLITPVVIREIRDLDPAMQRFLVDILKQLVFASDSSDSFIIKGDICWSKNSTELNTMENGYLVCLGGRSAGVFPEIPSVYENLPLKDYSGKLVIPGMVDLHVHAPQYAFRGLGMDMELLDWLQTYTFPEEAKYVDLDYAKKAYDVFVSNLKKSATTRAVVFATIHRDATIMLMDMLEEAGLVSYVGKVNMNRDAPDNLREPSPEASAFDTFGWINAIEKRYNHTMPILTPRFLPSCSDHLLRELHEVQQAYDLPIQSHLSENPGEVELVSRLFPKAAFYGAGYDYYGLFGGHAKTVMAHCIYCTEEEINLIEKNGVYVAHCPSSNMNLASGIAPIRKYLKRDIHVGLGSDVAAGESESMFRAVAECVKASKLYWRLVDQSCPALRFEEAFYLATMGGGEFFGNAGSFDAGYELDAIILDDTELCVKNDLSIEQRLQRDIYLEADATCIVGKYVQGRQIL